MRKINPQVEIFSECLRDYGPQHQFLGFIDADEVVVLRNTSQTLEGFLRTKESFGGVVLNWMNFGSSGHEVRPSPTLQKPHFYQHYNCCYPTIHVKSFVNTRFTKSASPNPHWFVYNDGAFAVNEGGGKAACEFGPWCQDPPSYNNAWINHYSIKSKEDFMLKIKRGFRSTTLSKEHTTWAYFNGIDAKAKNFCNPPS